MNTKEDIRESGPGENVIEKQDELLESLFSHASARQRAPAEDEQAIREALHDEWRDITRSRRRKTYFAYGIAASIILGAFISIIQVNRIAAVPDIQQVASIEKQTGNIFIHRSDEQSSESRRLTANSLFTGQVLSTTQGARLAVTMDNGESVRIDENSRLVFASPGMVELLSGRIYVDAGTDGASGGLAISTIAGVARHLGTQYLAAVDGDTVAISVREGRVLLSGGSAESIADAGQQISATAAGQASVSEIARHGGIWEWTGMITPEFVLDGRTAFDFIHWVGRETGRRVNYADDGSEQLARSTELRGSIDLEPMRALDLILQTSDLEPSLDNGSILISKRPGT